MITYNSPKFNNIIKKITKILLKSSINLQDAEQQIPESVINDINNYISKILEPQCKFLSTPCPCCGKTHLEPFNSTYKRTVIFRIENIIIKLKITVPRLICKNCNSTHALLPDFCIPLKQYSKQAILSIASEASKSSTENVAKNLNVESKQVRRFLNIVEHNKNNILLIHQKNPSVFSTKIDANSNIQQLIKAIPNNFTEIFYEEFRSIFLYIKGKRKIYMIFQKLSI